MFQTFQGWHAQTEMTVAVSVHPFGMNIMFEFDPAKALECTKQLCEFCPLLRIFPQQRKLIGSSAQNRSGVHWCSSGSGSTRFRRRFRRFRRRSGRPLVQSQVRFNRVPEKVLETEPGQVQQVSEKVRVRFNRVPKRVPGGFGAEPGQVQQGSGERSGEGVGGFGAEPG